MLFTALCVVHGCTHTTSWLIVGFCVWGRQGRQQNATATMTGLIVVLLFLWKGNQNATLLPWPLPYVFCFFTHHATDCFVFSFYFYPASDLV